MKTGFSQTILVCYAALAVLLGGCGGAESRLKALQARAARGEVEAQYALGELYSAGRGVERDGIVAAEWYRRAAVQGHARAQCCLAKMYATGYGVSKDEA